MTSGIRVGTAAITTRGMKEADCVKVVDWMDQIITDAENEATINRVRSEVNAYMKQFPLYEERVEAASA